MRRTPAGATADPPATTGAAGAAAGGLCATRLGLAPSWLEVGEPVADPEGGQQVSRSPWIRLDLPAQVLDVGVDRSLVRVEGDAMNGVQQLRAREDPPRLSGP